MSKRDIGASVRQRLLNQAHEQGRPFQELLQYFVMERFLYRLSKSQFRDSFILKGALLLTAWRAPQSRPTMDIDLMGRIDNSLEHIRVVVEEICGLAVEQDGVEFREETIEIQRIKEDAEYDGARVRLTATVSKARLVVQIDIGFGDSIVPRPRRIPLGPHRAGFFCSTRKGSQRIQSQITKHGCRENQESPMLRSTETCSSLPPFGWPNLMRYTPRDLINSV